MAVQFTDESSNTPTSWNWSFGDGRYNQSQNPVYYYAVAGKYNVSLTATNNDGSNSITKPEYINLTSDTDVEEGDYLQSWLHFNGADGSTTIDGEMGISWWVGGNAHITTSTYIFTPTSSKFNMSTGSGEVEMWVRVNSSSLGMPLIKRANPTQTEGWGVTHSTTSTLSDGWTFWMGNDVTGGTNTFTLPIGVWTHIAISADPLGNNYVYVNGELVATKTGMTENYDTANPTYIGYRSSGTTRYFDGEIDEFRLSINTQRWASNFTTPYAEYRGELEDPCPDINPESTFRYKTDPTSSAIISNQTNYGDGIGIRNRTVQIEGIYNADYIIGTAIFNPTYVHVQNVYLNKSTYATGMTLVSSSIDNVNGLIRFNVSRTPGFNNGTVRASIIDYQAVYYAYHDPGADNVTTYFANGYAINVSVDDVYPIHNFIGTPVTYMPWEFVADFTVSGATTRSNNTAVSFNSTFTGAYPNRWNWSFGDGTYAESTEANITHMYATLGLKTVSVREYMYQNTSVNSTKSRTNYLTITGEPVASFISNNTVSSQYGMAVQFNCTCINTPTMWNWSFGDGRWINGTTFESANPLYIYSVAGKYNVSMTATNAYGSNTTTKQEIVNLTTDADTYLKSRLHMNGAAGGTVFIGTEGLAWSPSSVTTETARKKFGNASALFNADTDRLQTPSNTAFNFSIGDFAIEGNVYVTASDVSRFIISRTSNGQTKVDGWGMYHSNNSGVSNAWVVWFGNTATQTGTFTLPINTWTHYAIERKNGIVNVYINGVSAVAPLSAPGNYDTVNPVVYGDPITGNPKSGRMYLDETCITNGVVRWGANFTTPYAEYRGVLETIYPDVNPSSTFRYKTTPPALSMISNQTDYGNGVGVRNRSIQIEGIINTSYVVGAATFDPRYVHVNNVFLNKSTYTTGLVLESSSIDNVNGVVSFNVSRTPGFNNGIARVSILDYQAVYYAYHEQSAGNVTSFFEYGYLINGTTNRSYPVHNFIGTQIGYDDWVFVANFTANATTINSGQMITFNSTFTGAYPNRWRWTFGDGTVIDGTEPNVTHTYTTAGVKNVSLTEYLIENSSVSSTKTRDLYITVSTEASFTATPVTGSADLIVQFTDTSTGNPVIWSWSAIRTTGGGLGNVFSNLQNPTHQFIKSGNYTVTLNTSGANGGGNVTTKTNYIRVFPLAQFIATPSGGYSPLSVNFTDYSTGEPGAWNWSFGDGTYSTLQNPSHIYLSNGNYNVSLTVQGLDGTSNITDLQDYITISDNPVIAGFVVVPNFGTPPLTVKFTDISKGVITNWNWSFGDGNYSNEQNPVHTYTNIGTYTVTLNASNPLAFNMNTIPGAVKVNAPPPVVAEFVGQPVVGTYPLSVVFTDLSYGYPTSWNWTFGDGNYSSAQFPTQIYANAGSYTVILVATNQYSTSTIVRPGYVVVSTPASPKASFVATPPYGNAPFTVIFTDLSQDYPTSWNWSFGDGEYSNLQHPSHTYQTSGIYTVSLTATNVYGSNTATRASYITVSNLVPIANFVGSPTYGVSPLLVSFSDVSDIENGAPSAWNWSFGDGSYSTLQNPSHIYSDGTYTVTMTVANMYGSTTATRVGYIYAYTSPTPTPSPVPTPTITVVPTLPPNPDILVGNQTIHISAEIGEKYVNWKFVNANPSQSVPPLNIYIDDSDIPVATNYTGSTYLMSDLAPGERHNIRIYNSTMATIITNNTSAANQTIIPVFVGKATAKTNTPGYEIMFLVALNLLLGVLLFILKDIRYLLTLSCLNIVISLMGMSLTGGAGLPYYLFIGCAVITFIILLVNGIPKLREEVDWL
jgi:PKD repeat protein